MCNTAPLLRIDFQVIKQRERSDRRRRPDIVKKLQEVEGGNAVKAVQSGWVHSVESSNHISYIGQVAQQLPSAVRVRPTLPVDEILQVLAFIP